jgi:hypothetical protein
VVATTGPVFTDLLNRREIFFAATILVTSDGVPRYTLHRREIRADMSPEEAAAAHSDNATGLLHGAIQTGLLHALLTSDTNRLLRDAILPSKP